MTENPSPTGEGGGVPQSDALSEATPDSLAELFSRDPEKLTPEDRVRMVLAYREQAKRLATAVAQGGGPRQVAKAQIAATSSQLSLDDII